MFGYYEIFIKKIMPKWKIQVTLNSVAGFPVQQKATLLTIETSENSEIKNCNERLFPGHHEL